MIRTLISTLVLWTVSSAAAQSKPVSLSFVLGTNNEQFVLPTHIDDKQVDLVRFYISSVELLHGAEVVWKEQKSYHLIDFTDSASLMQLLATPDNIQFDHIRLNVGIDSATNVAGVTGGDLDPAKGMYWAWQSGYINFKMEGSSSVVPSAKHEFNFHLGGYAAPNATLQTLKLPVNDGKIVIGFNIVRFLASTNLSEVYNIMSPGPAAVSLSANAAKCFSVL